MHTHALILSHKLITHLPPTHPLHPHSPTTAVVVPAATEKVTPLSTDTELRNGYENHTFSKATSPRTWGGDE